MVGKAPDNLAFNMATENTTGIMPPGHIKRYHPHGFKEDSTCKYIDCLVDGEKNAKVAKPHSYADIIKDVSSEDAASWLRDKLDIRCFHCKDESDFKYLGIYDLFGKRNFIDKGVPVSKAVFDKDVKAFYAVCKDLIERYPSIELDVDWFLPWQFYKLAGGKSTLDRRMGVSYITIGDVEKFPYQPSKYCHDDSRYIYDIIRHEIGHSLSTEEHKKQSNLIFDNLISEGKCTIELVRKIEFAISACACYAWDAVVDKWDLKYANELEDIKEESYAELFSAFTCPDYKGKFPKEIIQIPEIYCSESSQKGRSTKGATMDSIAKEIEDMTCFVPRPFWMSLSDAYYNPHFGEWIPLAEGRSRKKAESEGWEMKMPVGEPRTAMATWDYKNGGWIEFDSREAKCHYLEKLYGKTDAEIASLIADKMAFDMRYPELEMPQRNR